MLLPGKVCLVTGAASGIGRAIALAYAKEGAHVVVSDVHREGGEETVALLRPYGEAVFVPADISQAQECAQLVARTIEIFGRLDVACNNAGISGALAATADYPLEAWDQVIATNLSGVFYGMRAQLPHLLKSGGAIVNVASILGAVGFANAPAYTAAKHGVVGLTKTAALEYSKQGVRINAVGPAFIHTPMIAALEADAAVRDTLVAAHPIGRMGRAEEVAELVLWLSCARASFCTGSYFPVDGGYLAQ